MQQNKKLLKEGVRELFTYQEKTREAAAICLLGEDLTYCSLDDMQTHPPSTLAITWAIASNTQAANPSL